MKEYSSVTDKMGSDKENPVSHVTYGFATQIDILNEDGKIDKFIATHYVDKAINPEDYLNQQIFLK